MKKRALQKKHSLSLPRTKAYQSRSEWEKICWRKLLRHPELLDAIVTSYERHNIIMRAAVADRVNAGKSYTDIGRELWLSPQTISAIKKGLLENMYRSYADRGKTERKKKIYSPLRKETRKNKEIKIAIQKMTRYRALYP